MSDATISSRHTEPILPNVRSRPLDGRIRGPAGADSDGTSLVDVRPGQVVVVTEIFFQIVRNRCWELGVFEGELFECTDVDGEGVVLHHPRRGSIVVSRSCARFVLTAPVEAEAGPGISAKRT